MTAGRWVVRHACAGHKQDWDGDDDDRPLDRAGVGQAAALADLIAPAAPVALRSSPPERCVATLRPLGAALGLPVAPDDRLRAATGAELVALLDDPSSAGAVVCTHGEVMEPALPVLRARGLVVEGDPTDEDLLLKGAAWHLDPQDDGAWRLTLVVPIPVPSCPHHPR